MFKDKIVWITGASSGIGAALAQEFAAQGAKLILSARREEALHRVAEQTGLPPEDVCIVPFDVADETAIQGAVETASLFAGRIDMLINNAGISQRSHIDETEMQTYRKIMEVDFFGQVALTKAVLPLMYQQGSGHIVITSSVAGKMGVPFRTGYCAAKHAVMGFFDALRAEVAHRNIQVTTITPGFIRTAISENAIRGDGQQFGKTDESIAGGMDVEHCARIIMQGFAKGKQEIAPGVGFEMKALKLKRFAPNLLLRLMNKQYARMAQTNQIDT